MVLCKRCGHPLDHAIEVAGTREDINKHSEVDVTYECGVIGGRGWCTCQYGHRPKSG